MNIVITAGGLSEHIDKVRKITNSSTGKLGMIIANTFLDESNIDNIYYICPKGTLRPNSELVNIIEVEGAHDAKQKIEDILKNNKIHFFIHSMAVSDYTIDYVTCINYLENVFKSNNNHSIKEIFDRVIRFNDSKISSDLNDLILVLKPTPKIISIIKDISPATTLVGFKLLDNVEENELIKVAKELRDKNKCDYVVANDLSNIRLGNHKAFIIDKNNNQEVAYGKENIAKKLVKKLINDKQL